MRYWSIILKRLTNRGYDKSQGYQITCRGGKFSMDVTERVICVIRGADVLGDSAKLLAWRLIGVAC